jgi:protein SCO1/2
MIKNAGAVFCAGCVALILAVPTVQAQQAQAAQAQMPMILREVKITQRLDDQVPANLEFRDETGKTVRLGDFFGKRPIVLSLVYFECPALCTEVLNGELATMKAMSLNLGKDYEAITVSFEPKDTPAQAKAKRDVYAGQYGRTGAFGAWHFLTGDAPSINALTQAIGYDYAYDAKNKQYAHAAAILVLTPQGRIARYFYGVEYPARDLRLGLVEASNGKIGTVTDHVLLYCYCYDPSTGRYGLVIMRVIDAACFLTVLILGSFMLLMFRRDRKVAGAPQMAGEQGRG